EQYLKAVTLLERYAAERYDKGIMALAVRWVLDHPGVSAALWGFRHPQELAPVDEVMGWHLDDEARAHIEEIMAECVKEPVGPEFRAPPEHASAAAREIPAQPI